MSAVDLSGHDCLAALLTIPGCGLWYATVTLTEEVTLSGPVELRVLDTVWRGYVIAGASVDGNSRYRIAAGAGGWGKDLPPRAYANDAGVLERTIISDAASEAGEKVDSAPATRLGPHFDRPRAPASFLLNSLEPRKWYARADGVVTFAARVEHPAPVLPVLQRNPAARSVELAVFDSVAGLEPGAVTEYGAAADVEIELSDAGLRARLYSGLNLGRRLVAWARLIAACDPTLRFRGAFEYRIVTQSGERLNLQPVRFRSDLPDLARVPVRAGIPGAKALHALGSLVVVQFLDADPSRPVVTGFDAPDAAGWMPQTLSLGGPGALGVARRTDTIQAGPFAGTITGASSRVKAVV